MILSLPHLLSFNSKPISSYDKKLSHKLFYSLIQSQDSLSSLTLCEETNYDEKEDDFILTFPQIYSLLLKIMSISTYLPSSSPLLSTSNDTSCMPISIMIDNVTIVREQLEKMDGLWVEMIDEVIDKYI